MKRRINISLILLIVTIAATVFLFFYWSKEDNRTSLFAFNLGYTIFLELLFYGFIYTTRFNSKKILGSTYSVLGSILFFYLLFGVTMILTFNFLLLNLISVKWYYSVLVVGTLIGLISIGFTLKLNNNVVEENEKRENIIASQSTFLQELNYLENLHKAALTAKGLSESFESEYDSTISKLTNKVQFINPKIIKNKSSNIKIKNSIALLKGCITELNKAESNEKVIQFELTKIINDTISYLNSIK